MHTFKSMQRNVVLSESYTKNDHCSDGKRILYVIGSMGVGGAERQLLLISSELVRRGWNCEVFALNPIGQLRKSFEAAGVPVRGVNRYKWASRILRAQALVKLVKLFLAVPYLWWHLWSRKPHVVHFFLPAAYIVGGIVSVFGPRTIRVMSRRSLNLYQDKYPLCNQFERWLHRKMDFICGNSLAVLADLETEGVSKDRLRLIYNGVESTHSNKARNRVLVRTQLGVPLDALVLVMVANLIDYKGHADLINALGLIQTRLPQPWVCLCVGRDDGIGDTLRMQAEKLALGARVCFLGSRTDVADLIAASDIGVLCSLQEGFSNAILEGMAAGLPMVVTDVGGNAEAVLQAETGFIVPANSPQKLAEALLQMAHHLDRNSFGAAARKRVEALFSLEACVDKHEELYSSYRS